MGAVDSLSTRVQPFVLSLSLSKGRSMDGRPRN